MIRWEPELILKLVGLLLITPALLGLLFNWGLKPLPRIRTIAVGIVTLYFVAFGGFMAWRHMVPTPVHYFGLYVRWDGSLRELEAHSAYIVEVTALGQSRRELVTNEGHKWYQPDIAGGRTFTKARVEKVHSGDLSPGDIISVREHHYFARGIEGKYLFTWEFYLPMRKGQRYVLFLNEEMSPLSLHMGKYVVHSIRPSELTPQALELPKEAAIHPRDDDWEEYRTVYQTVWAKYIRE